MPFDLLLVLGDETLPAVAVAVVSPSAAWPKDKFPWLDRATGNRVADLRHFVDEHPGALVRLYVSDNKDYQVAAAAGFCYIEAAEFAKGIVP